LKTNSSIFSSTPFRTDGIPVKKYDNELQNINFIEGIIDDEEVPLKIRREDFSHNR